jgi:hypothetical protein
MRKELTWKDWLEFWLSGIPLVDWWYALTYTPTRLEKAMFPQFVKRPQHAWILATAEHFVYFILGYAYVEYVSAYWSVIVGAFALLVIVPLEFVLYKWKVRIFQSLSWKELALAAAWNIFNAGLYWVLGSLLALAL